MGTNLASNLRIFLWAALALLLFYDYQAWMHDYGPPSGSTANAPAAAPSGAAPPASDLGERIPQTSAPAQAAPSPAASSAAPA
ncbi:MAG TPA: hypothetical protein VEC10_04125, partial [Steroidobacteraceae bacterium]|nr:hypothetical protein [Steroidobacteraceae bacterium]